MDAKTIARFWSKVDVRGPDDCWPWKARSKIKGYGVFGLNGKTQLAHRVAFLIAEDRWPEPNALHACDNPPCCNRAHLFEGTQIDNVRDMIRKGRARHGAVRGEHHGSRTKPERTARGEAHGHAKLTDESVRKIRMLCAAGVSQRAAARRFGVTQRAVWFAVHRRTWAHIS